MSTLTIDKPRAEPILVEELPASTNAWGVCRKLAGWAHVLFLDSAQVGCSGSGRYSYVTADPFAWIWSRGRSVFTGDEVLLTWNDPFNVLEEKLCDYRTETLPNLPPFQGGAAGLFGYDLCRHLERLPRPRFDEFGVPDLAIGLYDWVVSFDHQTQRCFLVSTGFPEMDPKRRRRRARKRLEEVKDRLNSNVECGMRNADYPIADCGLRIADLKAKSVSCNPHSAFRIPHSVYSNFSREEYLRAVRRAIEYVHAGDCFQVNFAQRLLAPAALPPLVLYDRLRKRNPAPFAGYFDLGEFVIASASPERFLRLRHGEVETCPIKGTRPRGATPAEDRASALQLQASAKDRAENVMIVDLLRNDLGRVCRYGSVRVESLCRLESFAFVHHLVSEVRGQLRPELGPIDLLRAAFPGGSVTGAPKIRAMEIITELEQTARGPYCGSLGYIGFDGSMDTNLLIRTFTIGKGWMQFPVGGGIVADSVPEQEYAETWHKARGLLEVCEF